MPLIGVIDPTYKERNKHLAGTWPSWVTIEDALAAAELADPKQAPWNYELIAALAGGLQERGDRLSVTALLGCMRGTLLERKENYIGTLDGLYASFRGTITHAILERGVRPGSMAEWRFFADVDGVEMSCSPDLITPDTIWDWKTTENPPMYGMWPDHNLQLQYNRFCFNNATKWTAPPGQDPQETPLDPFSTTIRHLAIVYLTPKGPLVLETEKRIEVPKRATPGMKKVIVPDVWTDKEVLTSLRPRVEAWELAWNSYPDWPEGLDQMPGWAGEPTWACPGPPLCYLPGCLAKRYPHSLTWPNP